MQNPNEVLPAPQPDQLSPQPMQSAPAKKWYADKAVMIMVILVILASSSLAVYFILNQPQNLGPVVVPRHPVADSQNQSATTSSPYYQAPKLPLYQGPYTPVATFLPEIVSPGTIKVGVATPVVFEVRPQPYVAEKAYVELEQLDGNGNVLKNWGQLNDDGLNGDPIPQDGIYAITVTLQEPQTGFLHFRFKGQGASASVYSDPFTFEVSPANLPTGYQGESTKTINDPELGTVVADEVLITVKSGVSADRVQQIVTAVGGTITSRLPELNIWSITLPHTNDASNIKQAIIKFKTYPEVEDASPDGAGGSLN